MNKAAVAKGILVNLNVIDVLNEMGVNRGIYKPSIEQYLALLLEEADFSLQCDLNIVDGQYMEAGTGGDRWLGGDDIDRTLQELILKKVQDVYKIPNLESLIGNLPDNKRYKFEGEFRIEVEQAKIQLSSASTANINILGLLEDENGEWIDIDVQISKDEFNNAIKG